MRTFRNIAAVVIAYSVYNFAGSVLAYVAELVFGGVAARSYWGALLLVGVLPYLIVAPLAGAVVVNAVRPRGDGRWGYFFALLVGVMHFVGAEAPDGASATVRWIALVVPGAILFVAAMVGARWMGARIRGG